MRYKFYCTDGTMLTFKNNAVKPSSDELWRNAKGRAWREGKRIPATLPTPMPEAHKAR